MSQPSPTCADCGKPMRKEPMGLAWVHVSNGSMFCERGAAEAKPKPPVKCIPVPSYKPIVMTPHFIDHTIETFSRCCAANQAPGEYLQRAICEMLTELKRLTS